MAGWQPVETASRRSAIAKGDNCMSEIQKNAIVKCESCKKFNGFKSNGVPKACKLKRIYGCIQCNNRAAAQGCRG